MAMINSGPGAAAPATEQPGDKASAALGLMVEALELIDSSEGGGIAGAHLDLAIHRLREWIAGNPPK
jgi:hypothetical protein